MQSVPADQVARRSSSRWTAASTAATAVLLAPIASWQFGSAGIGIIAVFAAAILTSMWLSAQFAAAFFRAGREPAAILAGTGIRILVPLILAVAIAVGRNQYIPLRSLVYLVPLYLSMLIAETITHWRQLPRGVRQANSGSSSIRPVVGK